MRSCCVLTSNASFYCVLLYWMLHSKAVPHCNWGLEDVLHVLHKLLLCLPSQALLAPACVFMCFIVYVEHMLVFLMGYTCL